MAQGNNYRLVALYDRWSYDRWEDIHDPDIALRLRDRGPDLADLRLSATYQGNPSEEEIEAALVDTDACLSRSDGCHRRRAISVLDEARWLGLVGPGSERFMEAAFFLNGSPSPIIEQCYGGATGMMHGLAFQPSSGLPTREWGATGYRRTTAVTGWPE